MYLLLQLKLYFVTLQVQTLAKLVQLHTPQTGVYEITDPCKSDQQITKLIQARCDVGRDGGGWTVICAEDKMDHIQALVESGMTMKMDSEIRTMNFGLDYVIYIALLDVMM